MAEYNAALSFTREQKEKKRESLQHQSEELKILNIPFSLVRIEPTTLRVFTMTDFDNNFEH